MGVCSECVEVMEAGVTREETEFADGFPEEIVTEMNKVHKKIVQETGREMLCVCVNADDALYMEPLVQ